jgi:phage tail-like protein
MPAIGINTVANLAGISPDPFISFNFMIEVNGEFVGAFSECSGLQVETEIYDYREGGMNDYVHHLIGPTKYQPLILKHGLSPIEGLWSWHQEIVQGIEQGFKRRNGTIYLLDQQGIPVKWWNFKGAYPYKWTGPELRADSSSVAFESVEVVHRGLSRSSAANAVVGAAAQLF